MRCYRSRSLSAPHRGRPFKGSGGPSDLSIHFRPCVQYTHQRYHGLGFASVELEPPPTNGSFLSGLLCLRFQGRVDRRGSWEPHVRGWRPPAGRVRRRHHCSSSSPAPLSPKPATAAGGAGGAGGKGLPLTWTAAPPALARQSAPGHRRCAAPGGLQTLPRAAPPRKSAPPPSRAAVRTHKPC